MRISAQKKLEEPVWRARQAAHQKRVQPWVEPHLARGYRGESHPIEDFLWNYYSLRPALLMRWHPGVGVALQGEHARDFLAFTGYVENEEGVFADPGLLKPERRRSLKWMVAMLRATKERVGGFGCFGLHEWAMVYRAKEKRYDAWPLRLGQAGTDAVVESMPVRCTHFDAFRFFTGDARPMNRIQPTRPTSADFENPACLHANMDLYKWAFKLAPFTSAELVADCFELVREIRVLDMRASPYDFTAMNCAPVCIERPEGRAEYEARQREFAMRAEPLRERLIAVCEAVLAGCDL